VCEGATAQLLAHRSLASVFAAVSIRILNLIKMPPKKVKSKVKSKGRGKAGQKLRKTPVKEKHPKKVKKNTKTSGKKRKAAGAISFDFNKHFKKLEEVRCPPETEFATPLTPFEKTYCRQASAMIEAAEKFRKDFKSLWDMKPLREELSKKLIHRRRSKKSKEFGFS
jgi:hypothetical protein